MEVNLQLNPLSDHWLLQRIFSNLPLSEVKVARLVCRHWGQEGALNFRHSARALNVHVNPPQLTYEVRMGGFSLGSVLKKGAENERALGDFLASYKLSHTLHLSLLDVHPWFRNTPEYFGQPRNPGLWKQGNNLNFDASIQTKYLPQSGPFTKELRLELNLNLDQDFQMLGAILKKLEGSIESCFLEIIFFDGNMLKSIKPATNNGFSKIAVLAIHFLAEAWHRGPSIDLPVPGPSRILSLFPKLSFLDLIGPRPVNFFEKEIENKISLFINAAKQLKLKLDGIRAAPRTEQDFQAIANLTPLNFLYLNVCWKREEGWAPMRALGSIIKDWARSIERFDLEWRPCEIGPCPLLNLPTFTKLKSFTYASKFVGRCEVDSINRVFERERLYECLGYEDLFSDSGRTLYLKFPALESLSIILVEPGDGELWEEIFPVETNGTCISARIRTLVLTFAGECESEEIQKFPRTLFPKLRHFRHGKWTEDGDKLYVCHHEYDSEGSLTRKWCWLAAVKKFMGYQSNLELSPENQVKDEIRDFGNYFYTIRQKFRFRLGDLGFWDTGYDLERTEFHFSNSELI